MCLKGLLEVREEKSYFGCIFIKKPNLISTPSIFKLWNDSLSTRLIQLGIIVSEPRFISQVLEKPVSLTTAGDVLPGPGVIGL